MYWSKHSMNPEGLAKKVRRDSIYSQQLRFNSLGECSIKISRKEFEDNMMASGLSDVGKDYIAVTLLPSRLIMSHSMRADRPLRLPQLARVDHRNTSFHFNERIRFNLRTFFKKRPTWRREIIKKKKNSSSIMQCLLPNTPFHFKATWI